MPNECAAKRPGEEIRRAVVTKYRAVSDQPSGHFPYPIGRESAERLGYEAEWLAAVPPDLADRFVGVGNPFGVLRPERGERVLDVGCGCGLDTFVAATLVGPDGHAVGLDLTAEMLAWPRAALAECGLRNLVFLEGSAEELPVADGSFDLVISNGVLNLVPDKVAAFREIHRVLRPGGVLAAADLVVVESVPEAVLADMDAWSS